MPDALRQGSGPMIYCTLPLCEAPKALYAFFAVYIPLANLHASPHVFPR